MSVAHYENGKRTDIVHTYSDEIKDDDWSIRSQINTGELATRLGSLQGFDNRGRQIWIDDFEATNLKWNTTLVDGSTITLDKVNVLSKDQSVKFTIPASGTAEGTLWRNLYHPLTGKYGVEIAWSCSKTLFTSFKFGVILYDGTYKWNYYLDLYGIQRSFFMREHGFGNRTVGAMTCELADLHFWHKWKIVVDTINGIIPRVLIDGIEFNPSEYSVEHSADASDPHIYVFVKFKNVDAPTLIANIDGFILSHIE